MIGVFILKSWFRNEKNCGCLLDWLNRGGKQSTATLSYRSIYYLYLLIRLRICKHELAFVDGIETSILLPALSDSINWARACTFTVFHVYNS